MGKGRVTVRLEMYPIILMFIGLLALSSVAIVFADDGDSTLAPTTDISTDASSTPNGEVSTETTSDPTGEVSTETTSGPSGEVSTETTSDPTGEVSTETTSGPSGEVSTESTSGPTGEVSTDTTTGPTGEVTTATSDSEQTSTPSGGDTEAPEACVYSSQTWGVPNLGDFTFCLDGKPKLTECNENSYYVRNETVNGCVPAAKMNPSCVNLDIEVGACTGINLKQPQPSDTLTNFYLCTGENQDPIELTCLDDKAFLKQDGYLGCFDWTFWREMRDCQTYSNVAI